MVLALKLKNRGFKMVYMHKKTGRLWLVFFGYFESSAFSGYGWRVFYGKKLLHEEFELLGRL